MTKKVLLPDTNQNFWQLTCIQVMTYGLPSILIGAQISKDIGIATACVSILLGNLVLWVIGLSIVLMSHHGRNNAIQNIGNYFGLVGSVLGNVILGAAFLIWYPINIEYTVSALNSLIPDHFSMFNYLGIGLGVLVAILSSGGIVLIRKICVFAFVFFIVLFFISFFLFKPSFVFKDFGFSLNGFISVILVSLTGMVNLPTFFRHSRSKEDSVLSLTLMTIFICLFQICGIVSGFFSQFNGLNNLFDCNKFCIFFSLFFIFINFLCTNLGNIYFSSVVLEFFFPRSRKSIGYILIGLCGSLFYVFFGFSDLLSFSESIVEGFIVNLSIVLVVSFLGTVIANSKTNFIEKLSNNFCWISGCAAMMSVMYYSNLMSYSWLFSGISVSVLCFLFVFFIRKTVSSIKELN